MKRLYDYTAFLALVLVFLLNPAGAENWPGWRGPRGDGTSVEQDVPIHWDAESNIVWKTTVPGKGHASPIVWGDRQGPDDAEVGDGILAVPRTLSGPGAAALSRKRIPRATNSSG